MELKTDKIMKELKRLGKSQAWLARQIGTSRAALHYRLKHRLIVGVEDVAKVLDYEPKDLIR